LLDAGADPNTRDEIGSSPLHRAALNGRAEVIKALLDAGADPSARSFFGATAFDEIPEDSPLIGTPVWWRLNDARWREFDLIARYSGIYPQKWRSK
jgi:hypothetical protein